MSRRTPPDLTGSFTLLATPFLPDGRIDMVSFARLVERHVHAGSQGLFAVCGTAEMADLDLAERLALAREAVGRADGLPVLATANLEPDAAAQGEELERMVETGVTGVVLVPPRRGLAGGPEALYAYFAALAARSQVPVILYEWPGSSPALIPADVYGRLVSDCGVAGIKDTTCTCAGIAAKIAAAPRSCVYQANNPLLLEGFRSGARGTMTITSAVRPDLLAALWRAHVAGDGAAASALHREIVFLDAVLCVNHPGGAKWLLWREGVIAEPLTRRGRLPQDAEAAALSAWAAAAPPWQGTVAPAVRPTR